MWEFQNESTGDLLEIDAMSLSLAWGELYREMGYSSGPWRVLECQHEESENGVCNDCGDEVDWAERTFGDAGS